MSRVFVKEPDGDQVVNELPDRIQSPHINYVTPAGLHRLRVRVDGLLSQRKKLTSYQAPTR